MAVYQIKEYGKIKSIIDFPDFINKDSEIAISESSFTSIWNYILESQSSDPDLEKAFKLLTKNGKKIIQAQNYVGLIETAEHETVEILPKIYSSGAEASLDSCKRIFLKMVASLKEAPFISSKKAALEIKDNFPILELFISNFIIEVEELLLKGLKRDYKKMERNHGFLKGQLLFSKNLQHNLIDHSMFYVKFASYELNIPQNRLIKSALNKLGTISSSNKNRSKIYRLTSMLNEVNMSSDIVTDLRLCQSNYRIFADYEVVLKLAEVFLLNKSFTSFAGKNINYAILFPMQVLFENYVTRLFRKHATDFTVHSQHRKFFLVNQHMDKGKFRLKPDLFVESHQDEQDCFVLDMKWKVIDELETSKNYLISQADMYQLYAYGRKYIADKKEPKLILIYPMNSSFNNKLAPFYYETTDGDHHMELTAVPIDLLGDIPGQIKSILTGFNTGVAI